VQSYFVCAASTFELGTTSAGSNCNIVVDVNEGSPVQLRCNVSCISSDNFTSWYYYQSSNVTVPVPLYNGHGPSLLWSSRGFSVNYDHVAGQSVLKIEEVMLNNTGMYECTCNVNHGSDCKMRFCLSTGEYRTWHNSA